jgi:hypothetical protein
MPRVVLVAMVLAGCAGTQPPPSGTVPLEGKRAAPAKCSACHLPPREHSLVASQWPTYLKSHKRRLRLTDEEKAFLYDFLIGGSPPATATGEATDIGKRTE